MIEIEPSTLQVVGGFLMLAGLFVLREIASGALKEAGKDLWNWARHLRRRGRCRCTECELSGPLAHSGNDRVDRNSD